MTERGADQVDLYEVPGRFVTARDFAKEHLSVLDPLEADFLGAHLDWVEADRFPALPTCLARIDDGITATPAKRGIRSGERSAILPGMSVQLKGCRPSKGGRSFPAEELSFGEDRITRTEVPFGVMTSEQVIREILGHCFMREHRLPYQATPVGVWIYDTEGVEEGLCLLSRIRGDARLEGFLEESPLRVGEVVAYKGGGGNSSHVVGSELKLKGLNVWGWVESKARILSRLHIQGGFRGVLNSNLGNDVVLEGGAHPDIALCDFDTFGLVQVPDAPDRGFLQNFLIFCLVETGMGSLPILDYVEVPEGASLEERADLLGMVYFLKSSLWRAYWRHLVKMLSENGCRMIWIDDAFHRARRTEAFVSILSTRILDSVALRSVEQDHPLLVRHSEVS